MVEETAYEKYLHADKILSFQKKDDELVCDGERDFQGVQQEAELIWTRINFMLKRTHERMRGGDLHEACHLLEQAAALWSDLTGKSEELLWRLWPGDFLKIRGTLGRGSTADSPRYKESEQLARFLWTPYEKVLKAKGVALVTLLGDAKGEDSDGLVSLTKAMMWYDYRVQEFNLAHLYLVFGEIGDKTVGLKGGTTAYLIKRYNKFLFPKLWDSINELYKDFKS
jgi:tryptophan 2,3-dioxygenase